MKNEPADGRNDDMAKVCINEKTAARQRWIEKGLLERMEKCRFEDITVTDLCQQLDLSRRSFYRYFRDMEDVVAHFKRRQKLELWIIREILGEHGLVIPAKSDYKL